MVVYKGVASITRDEHDSTTYRKRVATWLDGNSISYEDTNFTTGDSPAILLVNTDLERDAHDGYIVNDGSGNFTAEISNDGLIYGGVHTIKVNEILELTGLTINRIRISWGGTNSSYRVFVA